MKRTGSSSLGRVLANAGAAAAATAALAGCSSFSGEKLGTYTDAKKVSREVLGQGLPYTLVKPQFRLTTTPAATAGAQNTVTLAVANIPDPTQRYALALHPGVLTNPDFKISFTTTGSVKTTTTTVTDQVVPTIKAIGSFAVSIASIGALHAEANPPSKTALRDLVIAQLKTKAGERACRKSWDYLLTLKGVAPEKLNPNWTRAMTTEAAMEQRLTDFESDDEMKGAFHYLTPQERACLQTLDDGSMAKTQEAFGDDTVGYVIKYTAGKTDDGFVSTLKAELATGKISSAANSGLWRTEDKARAAMQQKLIDEATVLAGGAVVVFAHGIIEMSPTDWRARHIAFIKDELARISVLRLSAAPVDPGLAKKIDDYRDVLLAQRAEAAGVGDLYARARALEGYLARVREKDVHGGHAPASAEYVQYRGELDLLNTQIESRVSAALASLAPPPPKGTTLPTLVNAPTCWMFASDFKDAARRAAACPSTGDGPPKFIVVLEQP